MLYNNDTSGCLTVISDDLDANFREVLDMITPLAQNAWNDFYFEEAKFVDYYSLDANEKKLFKTKAEMPKSFVAKYFNVGIKKYPSDLIRWNKSPLSSHIIWHKNYFENLVKGLKNKKIYKVRCSICGKISFIEEINFSFVKWKDCSGAECISHSVSEENCDYKNLCTVNNNSTELKLLDDQVALVESVSKPLSYYSNGKNFDEIKLHISYISDIHLRHHMHYMSITEDALLRKTIKNLYETMYSNRYYSEDNIEDNGILIFSGDVSSDSELTVKFLGELVKYSDYLNYKKTKKKLFNDKYQITLIKSLEYKSSKIEDHINMLKQSLFPYLDFEKVSIYKRNYRTDESWRDAINAYKSIKSYTDEKLSGKCDVLLDLLALNLDSLEKNNIKYNQLTEWVQEKSEQYKDKYGKSLETVTISDVYKNHCSLTDNKRIIFVLGNHEYVGFNSVKDAVEYYKKAYEPLGIKVLQNEYYEFSINDKKFIIYGGTGFAKYNLEYNADTLVCCNGFTREIEIEETNKFEEKYKEAKQIAHNQRACFICISHYPAKDCHEHIDNDTIYFYGHNHKNYYCRNEQKIIYADNQIGYKNPDIFFKTISTGCETNPYFSLEDGLYKTTIKDYLQFYRYIGEYIGEGKLLYDRCRNNKAGMYIIKRKGYYGFFIVNTNSGQSKGISIVNGGKTKKITKSTDLQWLFVNFEIVLYKYLQILTPLRKAQEQLSKELKELGLNGNIHGCIVDIDHYHHIMLNPMDNSITMYYSPSFGNVQNLNSFSEVLLSMKKKYASLCWDIKLLQLIKIQELYNNNRQKSDYMLGQIGEKKLIGDSDSSLVTVSRSQGMYGVSRAVNPLQRLFSGHVLRAFDLQLIDSNKEIE